MTDPKTPALPEPVAYQYRWKIDGEWVSWRFSDASQKHPALDSLEERPLFSATQLQEALDRAERAESEFAKIAIRLDAEFDSDSVLHEIMEIQADRDIFKDRATTAEAALEGARKVIEPFARKEVPDSYKTAFVGADDLRTAREWWAVNTGRGPSANPEVKG